MAFTEVEKTAMDKPIQAVDISNMVSKASNKAANATSGDGESASFSRVLSENEAGPAPRADAETAQENGNQLPSESAAAGSEHQHGVDSETRAGAEDGTQSKTQALADNTIERPLPVETAEEAGLVDARVLMADGGKDLPLRQVLVNEAPVAQATEGQVVKPATAAVNTEITLAPPATVASIPLQVPESLQTLPSGQGVAVPGTEQLLQPDGRAALQRILPSENTAKAPVAESVAAATREAAQLAVANQGAQDGLKQSLSNGRNFQPEMAGLVAQTSADVGQAVFSQALTDTTLALPSSKVQVPVGQPGWGRAVGQQVVWFVSQNISAANLRLNPQQLGPMEMHVSMDGDRASVAFVSQHAVVRDALESALPRLREMLAENGLNLASVNVSQQGYSGQRDAAFAGSRQADSVTNATEDGGELEMTLGVSHEVRTILGIVDYYV